LVDKDAIHGERLVVTAQVSHFPVHSSLLLFTSPFSTDVVIRRFQVTVVPFLKFNNLSLKLKNMNVRAVVLNHLRLRQVLCLIYRWVIVTSGRHVCLFFWTLLLVAAKLPTT
jgi:hypothetical protein